MPAEASVLGGGLTLTETVKGAASLTARFALYPSILYNLARNRLQDNWHWWDKITEHVILGALPFASMLETFQDKGVRAVVTLNEDFEVFISSEQYKENGINHLHIPTVDYLYAPPLKDLHRGVQFIAEQAAAGEVTYVHCKAGRGRSTTLVICYLVREMHMSPQDAYAFVRQKRPQVCLADGQWNAVREFHASCIEARAANSEAFPPTADQLAVEPDEAGTPLDDLTPSESPSAALEPRVPEGDTEAAPHERAPAEGTAVSAEPPGREVDRCLEREEPAAAPVLVACTVAEAAAAQNPEDAGSCLEAAADVCGASQLASGVGEGAKISALQPAAEHAVDTRMETAGAGAAGTGTDVPKPAAARLGAQCASAASLTMSEPVLVTASDADSMRSTLTAFAAAAAVPGGADEVSSGVAARSAGSLSRASLSMVLCEDFGTALCDADDPDEAAFPPPPDDCACSGAPDAAKSGAADVHANSGAADGAKYGAPPTESAAKRRRSAEAFPLAQDGEELTRVDSGLQLIHDWASVCRDGSLETLER
ncbi:probable phosphatidylglycerophosphatase and protein-tyrosine phosphatase at N-terminal half [Coccomyxa sp. Obi]|nr:probable phosphatidylglycerophosphatase and protein-tyrosine phosphatase at N-terminal half [Coccomyxa sp. Obi]